MHDPLTVAFELPPPFKLLGRFVHPIVTIWHRDPELGGDEDSCDWFGRKKTRQNGWGPYAVAEYRALPEETQRVIDFMWWRWREKLTSRPWYRHPRWHVHHWEIQVRPLNQLRRWLFSRCCVCGGRFRWGEAPIGCWSGTKEWHSQCDRNIERKEIP